MNRTTEQMVAEELARANQTFPLFASWHEAYAVLLEEVEEASEEMSLIEEIVYGLWLSIRNKESTEKSKMTYIDEIRKHAVASIAELIQVTAMCDKTIKSMKGEIK